VKIISGTSAKAKINDDWSITIYRVDGTKGKIPTWVLLTRDRRGAAAYIYEVVNKRNPKDVLVVIDMYDKEFLKATGKKR
jgi:hypothetical protein